MDKVKHSFTREVFNNVFFSGITAIVSKVGALFFTIIVARIFLPEAFGVYSLALTIILSILVLSDLGLEGTTVRYLSESIGKNKWVETRSRFWFVFKLKLFLSLGVSFLLFILSGIIASFFGKPELIPLLKIGSVYLFLNTLANLASPIFLAFQKAKYSTISEAIFQVSKVLLLFLFLPFFKSVSGIFITLSVSLFISMVFSVVVLLKRHSRMIKGKIIPVERRKMLKFSGFMAIGAFTILIFSNIDKLVLGYFLDSEFVGFYTAILTIVSGIFGIVSISSAFLPAFTRLKGESLKNAFKKVFKYASVLAFPAMVGLAFIIMPLLKLLYGVAYVPPQYEFAIFLTSLFLTSLIVEVTFSSLYKTFLDANEKPNVPAWTNLGTAILNLVLNVILVYFLIKINLAYGLVGASAATFLSRYFGLFTLSAFSKKKMGVSPESSSVYKPIIASIFMLGYLFLFSHFIPLGILTGLVMILSAATIYFAIVFAMKVITIEEIKLLLK